MSSDAVQHGAEIAAKKKVYNYILFEDDSSEAIIPFRYTSSDTLLYTMKGSQSLHKAFMQKSSTNRTEPRTGVPVVTHRWLLG